MIYPNNTIARNAVQAWLKTNFNVANNYKARSLVPLSGGLDSVALLATLLAYTNHEIHAHHVDIRNAENRGIAELQVLTPILEYLSLKYRSFTYSSSVYQMMVGEANRVGADASLVMFMASRVNIAFAGTFDIIWTAHMKGKMAEYIEASAIHAAAAVNYRQKPLWATPFLDVAKFNLYNAIPPELAEMTWSCRTPKYSPAGVPSQCNDCHACRAINFVRLQVSRFNTAGGPPPEGT